MACALTAFSVKIVASGETAIKAAIAREVLYEWNAGRAWEERRALLPLCSDQATDAPGPTIDLLVAFYRAAQKTPDLMADSAVGRHLQSGRPALIYLSEARTDLNGPEWDELADFRNGFPAEAMIDSFKDEKEFRARFAQKIEALLRYHPHFQTSGELSLPTASSKKSPVEYSQAAQTLLMAACDDPEAYVARTKDSRGLKIQVNGGQYVEAGNPASAAKWEAAFHELQSTGLIRDAGCNGQLFQISSEGFKYLEIKLGKTPIGYIAELGSV